MKLNKSILPIITMAFSAVMLMTVTGCEGPEGPAGADGIDGIDGIDGVDGVDGMAGADGDLTCITCHNSDVQQENRFAYNSSQHASGSLSLDYAGGRSYCAQCHSHEGFAEFMTTGDVADNIANPTQITCQTCHSLHTTFDSLNYALRVTGSIISYIDGSEIDIDPASNLCGTCHQARKDYDYYDDGAGDSVMVTSTHAGPHGSPQSSFLLGTIGDPDIGSIDITALGAATHKDLGCNGCHMYEGTDPEVGGHTFKPNIEACGTCHAGTTDFDIGSAMTDLEAKLVTLEALLEAQVGQGIGRVDGVWTVIADSTVQGILHDGHPNVGQFTRDAYAGFWNYELVTGDKSMGVHNMPYAEALIDNAIEGLE